MAVCAPVTERRAGWLAWSVSGIAVALVVMTAVLHGLNRNGDPTELFSTRPLLFAAVALAVCIPGSLIVARWPRNPVGWLFLVVGLSAGLSGLAIEYGRYAVATRPGSLPGGNVALWLGLWVWQVIAVALALVCLLFPSGTLPSPRWRAVVGVVAVVGLLFVANSALQPYAAVAERGVTYRLVENPLGLDATRGTLDAFAPITRLLMAIALGASIAAVVVRYPSSRGDERQQLRWFAYGAVVAAASLIWVQYQPDLAYRNVISGFSALVFVGAVAVAILRYHLYDIDVVVNRTIVYGALAAFITAVYLAVVVGVGSVVSSAGGSGLFLPILATALVGVVFQPVRGRLQALANRLVYGTRATPYEVLSELTRRVAMVEAGDDLLPRMARILAEACAAVDAQVWLVVDGEPQLAGAWPLDADVPAAPRIELGSPRVAAARHAVPVRHAGELLGVLTVSPRSGEGLTPRERTLVAELGLQAGLVLQNIRLESELRAHVDELRASRARIVQAEDLERRRIERDLHDGAQQRLVLLAYSLGMARARFGTQGDAELRITLDEAASQAQLALAELRAFARGIHPAILTEAGLGPALQSLAERSPVPATVGGDVSGRLPAPVEATAYFVVCEALANVARHADASAVAIHVARVDGRLVVEVADDGVGGAVAERGSGLRGLADRVLVVNGRFEVHSPPGGGTRLVAEIPCAC